MTYSLYYYLKKKKYYISMALTDHMCACTYAYTITIALIYWK